MAFSPFLEINMQPLQLVAPLTSNEQSLIVDNCEACKDSGWQSIPDKGIRPCPLCALKKAIAQPVSNSRIPVRYQHCTVENFMPVGNQKSTSCQSQKAALEATKTLIASYPESKHGLLLLGPCGIGKTHLAVAAGLALQTKGANVRFYDFRELLKLIQESYNSEERNSEWKLLTPARNAEVLILDELGAARPTDWALDKMTQIINQRYNDCRLTIFTSNFSDLVTPQHRHTLSDRVGPRIRSRLREMCVTVEVSGKDYRERLEREVKLREAA